MAQNSFQKIKTGREFLVFFSWKKMLSFSYSLTRNHIRTFSFSFWPYFYLIYLFLLYSGKNSCQYPIG